MKTAEISRDLHPKGKTLLYFTAMNNNKVFQETPSCFSNKCLLFSLACNALGLLRRLSCLLYSVASLMMRLKIVYYKSVNDFQLMQSNKNDVKICCHGNVKRVKDTLYWPYDVTYKLLCEYLPLQSENKHF